MDEIVREQYPEQPDVLGSERQEGICSLEVNLPQAEVLIPKRRVTRRGFLPVLVDHDRYVFYSWMRDRPTIRGDGVGCGVRIRGVSSKLLKSPKGRPDAFPFLVV